MKKTIAVAVFSIILALLGALIMVEVARNPHDFGQPHINFGLGLGLCGLSLILAFLFHNKAG